MKVYILIYHSTFGDMIEGVFKNREDAQSMRDSFKSHNDLIQYEIKTMEIIE